MEVEPMEAVEREVNASLFTPNDNTIELRLRNVVPCNLRYGAYFLSSLVTVDMNRCALSSFLRCYGYLMYDREEKIRFLMSQPSPETREIAAILSECRDAEQFKLCVEEQLENVRAILDSGAAALVVNYGGDDDDNGNDETTRNGGEATECRDVLDVAKRALEQIFEALRNGDLLLRSSVINDFCQFVVAAENSLAYESCSTAWRDATSSLDVHGCVSMVLRDAIVTTGMMTYNACLLMLRSALLTTFLIVNFARNSRRPTIELRPTQEERVALERASPAYARVARQYLAGEHLDVDAFVATTVIAVLRTSFLTFLEWPRRVRDIAVARGRVPVNAIADDVIRTIAQKRYFFKWLRAMHRRGETRPRLYVNSDVLLNLLERVAMCDSRVTTNGDRIELRNVNETTRRELADWEDASAICLDAIARHARIDEARSLGPREFVALVAEGTTGIGGIERPDDLARDVSWTLLFAVLSCARHGKKSFAATDATAERAQNSRIEFDPYDESYRVLALHAMHRLARSRVSLRQIENFFSYITEVWNDRVGLADMDQLGDILLRLYKLMPSLNSTLDTPTDR